MKKIICKISVLLGLLFVIAAFGVCSFADSELTVNVGYDPQTKMLTVYGQSEEFVIITVVEESVDYSSLYESQPTEFNYITPNDGQYSFVFDFSDAKMSSKYIVSATTYTQSASDEFICYSYESAQEIFESELKGKSEDAFIEAFKSNALSFGIELNDEISPDKEAEIFRLLYACGSENGSQISADYKKSCLYAELALADEDKIEEFIFRNAFELGIDFQKDWSDELTKVNAEAALSRVAEYDFADLLCRRDANFGQLLDEIFLSLKAMNVQSWLELKNIITDDYAEFFSNQLLSDEYSSIKNKDDVFKAMLKYKSDFDAAQKISEKFKLCILETKEYEDERNSQKSPSHGGGGGGGKISPVVIDSGYTPPKQEIIPAETQIQSANFKDVTKSHWCYEDINTLYAKGIINGYEDSMFNPDKTVTRAEFVKMLILAMGLEVKDEYSGSFLDVDVGDWFALYVDTAFSKGAVKGDGALFYPHKPIKREEAALIVSRMAKDMLGISQGQITFSDNEQISDYAKEAVTSLASSGIINGFEDGSFMPKKEITRAESARIINKVLKIMK